jgi:hypothetical protein
MANVYSNGTGNAANFTGEDLDNTRRVFNFGERVAELSPQQSPFFVYLSKVAKKATNDPVFKFLEQRHQWQRRNMEVHAASNSHSAAVGVDMGVNLQLKCGYDSYGKLQSATAPTFLVGGTVIAVKADDGSVYRFKIDEDATISTHGTDGTNGYAQIDAAEATVVGTATSSTSFAAGNQAQVVGSAWAEGTDSAVGWEDKLYDREGYCQIFKTGMNIFSGTAMATEYRGIKNEYQRIWQDKLMEHKMDIEQAMLFGVGSIDVDGTIGGTANTTSPLRTSWGIVPYTEQYGKIYNMSYASSGYDAFLDAMEDFFAPEGGNSGEKLVLASRKVITYLNKLGAGSFMNNSVGSSQYRLDVNQIPGAFGHTVTVVNTIFGNLHFVAEPLLRGPWEDFCVCVDLSNVAYRPLVGNGVSRDTFIETNIQNPGIDGRQDQIITEGGLEISLPETHAVLKFS